MSEHPFTPEEEVGRQPRGKGQAATTVGLLAGVAVVVGALVAVSTLSPAQTGLDATTAVGPPIPTPYAPQAAPEASQQAPEAPAPSQSRTPRPIPTLKAVYGADGLAGKFAKTLGYDSMSQACAGGVEWVCGVRKIEPSAGSSYTEVSPGWDVYTKETPLDGNGVAAAFLAEAPESVEAVTIRDTTGVFVQTVGEASRKAEA